MRRAAVRLLLGACLTAASAAPAQDLAGPPAAQPSPQVLVISRERIVRETVAGQALREAEQRLGAEFQARVDEVTRALEAEEAELARLRPTLPREEFAARAAAFDLKVRTMRRNSQAQAADLQQAFRTAREGLVAELVPILVDLLRQTGAHIVLDADQILVAGPAVNRTEEVIRLFDARVAAPRIEVPPPQPLLPPAE